MPPRERSEARVARFKQRTKHALCNHLEHWRRECPLDPNFDRSTAPSVIGFMEETFDQGEAPDISMGVSVADEDLTGTSDLRVDEGGCKRLYLVVLGSLASESENSVAAPSWWDHRPGSTQGRVDQEWV